MEYYRGRTHKDFVNDLLNSSEKCIWIDMLPQVGFTASIGGVCLRELVEFTPTDKILDGILDKKSKQVQLKGLIRK